MLTIELLREFFHYDPDTGDIRWKKDRPPRGRKGALVGYLDSQGYRVGSLKGTSFTCQKLAWWLHHGQEPECEVMLVDGDRTNFRLNNLVLRKNTLVGKGEDPIARLRQLIAYNPDTGEFKWLMTVGKARVKNSPKAGCSSKTTDGRRRLTIRVDTKTWEAGRLAYALQTGVAPPGDYWIDHKDGDPLNNRWENLRLVSPQANASNQGSKPPRKANLPRGVEEFKREGGNDYGYAMMHKGTRYRKRGFPTPEAAHEAYKALHQELHGEFSVYASRPEETT